MNYNICNKIIHNFFLSYSITSKILILVLFFILDSNLNVTFGSNTQISLKYCKIEASREYTNYAQQAFINGEMKGPFYRGDKIDVTGYTFNNIQDLKSCEDYKIKSETSFYKQSLKSITEVDYIEYENSLINLWKSYLPLVGVKLDKKIIIKKPNKNDLSKFDTDEIILNDKNLVGYCIVNSSSSSATHKRLINPIGFKTEVSKFDDSVNLIMTCQGKEVFEVVDVTKGIFNRETIKNFKYLTKAELIEIEDKEKKLSAKKEQELQKLKAECNIQKFQDILNCDIETVIQKCDSLIGGGPSPEEYTFTKEPNNTFIRIDLKNCKSIFGNIFGMKPNVYAAWLWDKKKENNKALKHYELFDTKEKVNIVLIHLYDLNKDKFNELYDYLKKNKKSSGSINKTSEVIDGKKNFVLWAFDKSEILLILKPSYLGDGWVGYLAYVRPELVSKIINSFLETDTSNSQL